MIDGPQGRVARRRPSSTPVSLPHCCSRSEVVLQMISMGREGASGQHSECHFIADLDPVLLEVVDLVAADRAAA
jgi:hypothetical protein